MRCCVAWAVFGFLSLACAGAPPEKEAPTESSESPEPASTADASPETPAEGQDDAASLEPSGEEPAEAVPLETYTYERDVEPIVQRFCVSCHAEEGLAPFALAEFGDVFTTRVLIKRALEDHTMPPLPADPGCRPFEDPRLMPNELREVMLTWIDQGAGRGEEVPEEEQREVPPMPSVELGPPSDVFDSGLDFVSSYEGADEYRCFIVDPKLEQPADAVAFSIGSTNLAIVHHAFIDVAVPSKVAELEALDAADPDPGFLCFGGTGFDSVRVGAYVPGSQVKAFPADTGFTVPAGSKFVLSMHYNYLNNRDANRLSVHMWRANAPLEGTPRAARLRDLTFMIPAGDDEVTVTNTTDIVGSKDRVGLRAAVAGRAWGASGHMHMLGKSIRVDLLRAAGGEECLLDIPSWNFHWQGDYRFREPLDLVPGDQLRVTCTWDNSAANQPFVDGEMQEPRDVRWGEGSLDEMCLASVSLTD